MKSAGVQAILFGSIVGGMTLLSPYVRTHQSLKKEVIEAVNTSLVKGKYGIGLNRSCSIRLTPGTNGILVCQEDVSGRMIDILPIDDSVRPGVISETVEIRDVRPTGDGILNADTGELLFPLRS